MKLWAGTPYEYSRRADGLVFTAGACPLDENGEVVSPGDVVGQAERTLENLLAALQEAGVGTDSLLKTTIYVAAEDRSDLVRVWEVVAARLGRAPSTLLGVSLLGYPGQLVEIEAVATAEQATGPPTA
ncbi:MAG: RidA family protein [Actinobacteria bacterium]|nr:RidA family protein [Actinomycetota bacterium]